MGIILARKSALALQACPRARKQTPHRQTSLCAGIASAADTAAIGSAIAAICVLIATLSDNSVTMGDNA